MATSVTHPTFYEGEILPAADLVASISYPRGQIARHERYLHTWGIASGLTLALAKVTGGSPVLTAGIAVDGTGREVVVAADVPLDPVDFQSQVYPTNDPTTLYPVFLTGLDVPQTETSSMTGACSVSQPTAAQETHTISYGPPGSELDSPGTPSASFADGAGDKQWKILVGFVRWDVTKSTFAAVLGVNSSGIGPQYVGVNAAQVVSGSGSLVLSTHPKGYTGASPVLAISLDEDPSGGITFGSLNSDGSITETLTISSQGDITTKGQIRGALATGTVQVESGLATHGTVLPLPSGVTQAQIDAGKAVVHISVALRLTGAESASAGTTFGVFPLECYVDNARTVHCRVRQFELLPTVGSTIQDVPAVCEYIVAACSKSS